jgi:hypothetical protein
MVGCDLAAKKMNCQICILKYERNKLHCLKIREGEMMNNHFPEINEIKPLPETTLHDLRYGEYYQGDGVDDFVWVFLISGAAPVSHFNGGYKGAVSERQPPMYFPLDGGTLIGVSKPGEIVWSRIFVMGGELHADLGRATVVELPEEETERRWQLTTPQWPIMHAVLHGVTRDQMMARHKANHLNVAYAPNSAEADKALAAKGAMLQEMGVNTHLCG